MTEGAAVPGYLRAQRQCRRYVPKRPPRMRGRQSVMQAEANPPLSASWGCRHSEKRVTTKFSLCVVNGKYFAVTVAVKGLAWTWKPKCRSLIVIRRPVSEVNQSTNPIFTGVTTTNTISCPEPRSFRPRNPFHLSDEILQQRWHPNSTCDLVSQEHASSHRSLHPCLLGCRLACLPPPLACL